MTAEQEQLINDNYKIAPFCVQKFAAQFPMIEWQDMLSIAHIGLIYAAQTYDPAKGTFANYACNTIRLRMSTERTSRTYAKRRGVTAELTEWAAVSNDGDIDFSIDFKNTMEAAMRGVDERARACFTLRYVHGYTLREIGEMIGASHQAAYKLSNRVSERFRMFWDLAHRKEGA